MAEVSEHRTQVEGVEVFWRRAEPDAGVAPTLFVHGVPTSCDDWLPFLERCGGVALDLPGFGRSAKPADFDYSIAGYERFLASFIDAVGLDRFSLVVHDWGAVALPTARRLRERLDRLVLFSCLPLLPGYRWHRIARIWRTPVLGELLMGFSTRFAFKRLAREASATPGPALDAMVQSAWSHFDHGTQRAILKLHRSSPEPALEAAGRELHKISAPALVLWPDQDPYIGPEFGPAYAEALGGPVELEVVGGAGHWSWLDRPELVERAAEFLAS